MVSTSDVENYKQIKSDLDELRLLVEKSELWVYKSKKDLPTETRLKKVTSGLRKEGDSKDEPRKSSLDQQDLDAVVASSSTVRKVLSNVNCSHSLIILESE